MAESKDKKESKLEELLQSLIGQTITDKEADGYQILAICAIQELREIRKTLGQQTTALTQLTAAVLALTKTHEENINELIACLDELRLGAEPEPEAEPDPKG